jgi:hypothetical protein
MEQETEGGISSQLGMRKSDKEMHEGRKIGWNICRKFRQKGPPRNFYVVNQ